MRSCSNCNIEVFDDLVLLILVFLKIAVMIMMMMVELGNTAAGSAQLLKLPARRQFSSFALLSAPSGGDDHGKGKDKGSPPFRILGNNVMMKKPRGRS